MHSKRNIVSEFDRVCPDLEKLLVSLDKEYNEHSILPRKQDVFKAFRVCPYGDLKVVIIGQDPYYQKDVATGIAFANKAGTIKLSPSLELIRDRVRKDFYLDNPADFIFDCTLESWAKQGILLLNSSLTVIEGKPGSHSYLWYPFIKELLINLSNKNPGLIYILFGAQAQEFKSYINPNINYIFEYKHPAYYSRINQELICDGFLKAQDIIKKNNNLLIQF